MARRLINKKLGRKVSKPGTGKGYSAYLKWKNKDLNRYKNCLAHRRKWRINIYKQKPWLKNYHSGMRRCNGKGHWYYNNKIKFNLTHKEVEKLWFRDKAYKLNQPCLDRKNTKKNYTFNNCRFIESVKNHSKKLTEENVLYIRKSYALKKYNICELAKIFNVNKTNISAIILRKTWKWVK